MQSHIESPLLSFAAHAFTPVIPTGLSSKIITHTGILKIAHINFNLLFCTRNIILFLCKSPGFVSLLFNFPSFHTLPSFTLIYISINHSLLLLINSHLSFFCSLLSFAQQTLPFTLSFHPDMYTHSFCNFSYYLLFPFAHLLHIYDFIPFYDLTARNLAYSSLYYSSRNLSLRVLPIY